MIVPANPVTALQPAAITRTSEREWALSGSWTVPGLGDLARHLADLPCPDGEVTLDGAALDAVDTAGAWVLQRWLRTHRATALRRGWPPRLDALMALVAAHEDVPLAQAPRSALLARVGKRTVDAGRQTLAMLAFFGETAHAAAGLLRHRSEKLDCQVQKVQAAKELCQQAQRGMGREDRTNTGNSKRRPDERRGGHADDGGKGCAPTAACGELTDKYEVEAWNQQDCPVEDGDGGKNLKHVSCGLTFVFSGLPKGSPLEHGVRRQTHGRCLLLIASTSPYVATSFQYE